MTHETLWNSNGSDKSFEYYRQLKSDISKKLRNWVDKAYYEDSLKQYLDSDFVNKLGNNDFFARLWELELAEWFKLLKFKLVPTNGVGPDFCIELCNGSKIWVEAVLPRAGDELEQLWRDKITSGGEYDTPRQETALRYTSSLFDKAKKINNNYLKNLSKKDYVIIAVSAFPPGPLHSDIDLFMRSVLPIEDQVIHFSIDGSALDESIARPTHTISTEYIKKSGQKVEKQFLYPGKLFPFIDGVIFSEASNLQQLLGTFASHFDETTNRPHLFSNYSGKDLPKEFTKLFYFHKFTNNEQMVGLEMINPLKRN